MTTAKIKALKRAYGKEQNDTEDAFYPTKRDYLYWHTFINSAMFAGVLEKSTCKIERLRNKFGQAIGDIETGETIIRLSHRFVEKKTTRINVSARQMFINTLAHEMVHVLQFQLEGNMNHGEFYRLWKKKFARIGIAL